MSASLRVRSFTASLLLLGGLATTGAAQRVPSPQEVLGHRVGESGWLADWAQIRSYFERLDQASPMVTVERIGETVQGRPMIMAVITSPENQRRIEEIRADQARLADPRGVPQAEIDRLIETQPAVTLIGASLHGNEIMATQMSMELAHDLVTDTLLTNALEDVVVLLVPGMNPDGLDIVRDWWMRTRQTEYAGSEMPWLYHFYVGHDNNRDFFMVTQPETQAVTRVMYEEWFPEVYYDVHQMGNRGPRYFIPPFDEPTNPNIHPLIVRETNLVGVQMALELTDAGKTGIAHQNRYDLWWHGGARTVPARHNVVGILSEAASAYYGDPITQSADELSEPDLGSMFPEPWEGGEWTPRDIVEYELISAKALVKLLDRQRREFVENYVELAREQIEAGREGDPFAYVVPADQTDLGTAAEMLRVLRTGGVEVHRAPDAFQAGGRTFPAGSWVVLMAQPYRAHAKDLLEPQEYPEMRLYPGGPPRPPYDLAGWTLPLQMGVEAVEIDRPFPTGALVEVDSIALPAGEVTGAGSAYALDPTLNNTHRAIHEALREGGRVSFSTSPVRAGDETWPAGTPIVSGLSDLRQRVQRWANQWGVDAAAVSAPGGDVLTDLRVALYKPWTGNMDEGWTRWLFEEWGVPFDTIHDAQVREGDLEERFDVIVIPDMDYDELVRGLDPEESPAEYAGGIGQEGADELEEFVREGGRLLLLDSSSEFAIRELGVPVVDVEARQEGEDPDRWYAPGSILRVAWDPSHPIATGMPEESAVFYANSPVFEVQPGAENVTVVARYPQSDILLSGYSQGEERIAGKAALVEAEIGEGEVVMFGFRPQHRAQPHETFKVLFNAMYGR